MSRAWQEPAPAERLGEARPGALLTAAAAVPIGLAVLIAAGLLPWGARLALGAALVVLGLRVRTFDGTTLGARIRPEVVRALAAALVVGGGVVVAAALGVGLDGGHLESRTVFDERSQNYGLSASAGGPYGLFAVVSPTLDAWAGVVFGALLAAVGAVVAREIRPAGTGVALGGVGLAVVLVALTGGGAIGLGPDARATTALLLTAAGAAVVALRPGDPVARAVGVAAGLLLALVVGEATGLVPLALSGGIGPPFLSPTREGAAAGALVVGGAVAAVLLVIAARRRDVLLGTLPAGVLLLAHPVDGATGEIGVLVVPVLLLVAAVCALAGLAPLSRLVPRPAAPVALAAALVVLLVGLVGAFGVPSVFADADSSASGVRSGPLLVAIASTFGILLVAGMAAGTGGAPGAAMAATAIVGLHLLHPLAQFRGAAPGSFVDGPVLAVVLPLGEAALAIALARRHASPAVLAATGLLVVSALETMGIGLASAIEDISPELVTGLALGPSVLAIAGGATYALVGPARHVLRAQAFAAGAIAGSLLFATFVTSALAFGGEGAVRLLDGGRAVLALALVSIAGLGVALLAASTARRASTTIAAAVVGGTTLLSAAVAAVASSVAQGSEAEVRSYSTPAVQAVLGFEDAGSFLQRVPAGWPVVLAVVGAVLLATGAWLESRRPLPPDAPLG